MHFPGSEYKDDCLKGSAEPADEGGKVLLPSDWEENYLTGCAGFRQQNGRQRERTPKE